ncbi:MAG: hypothetical protein VX733_13965 [Candidatus Latescibacterota bacterium]|nr:hypothetical protein [Candidatus Latescibacterota bacterium]
MLPYSGFGDAVSGLQGFEQIWMIFELHLNETWYRAEVGFTAGTAERGEWIRHEGSP